jgi:L-2-hydroxyglutarate oxidase
VVVGGGIVGASTAWQLLRRHPNRKILLLDKEAAPAQHQTARNSGVIHAGVYYTPGSLKARFCREGLEATIAFCRENAIAFEQCGKLLVATDAREDERMVALYHRCRENGIDVELLDAGELRRREPRIRGTGAIFVRSTGIVNYAEVAEAMVRRFRALGGEVRLATELRSLRERHDGIVLETGKGTVGARFLVACAGLMADRVARMAGIAIDFRIVPYRGEYYRLPPARSDIVRHLVYPIPDPQLPFLGVHLTRMIDGSVTVGPNAVQGWKREGYGPVNFSLRDTREMLAFPGFWRALSAHLGAGLGELRDSWWKRGYLRRVQKYCPEIRLSDLQPYPAGVRAQAVLRDGALVHDFLFAESPRSLHVCNAPSPAATSAIPIGGYICDMLAPRLNSLS